jgi:hypothetical protein
MKVRELLNQLQQLPPETNVVVDLHAKETFGDKEWISRFQCGWEIVPDGEQPKPAEDFDKLMGLNKAAPQLWIARDADGTLCTSYDKPTLFQGYFISADINKINRHWFPSVTFENSPQKVELKLIQQ